MVITWRIPSWWLLVLAVAILATATRKARKAIPYVSLTREQSPMLAGQTIITSTQSKMADALAKRDAILNRYQTRSTLLEQMLERQS